MIAHGARRAPTGLATPRRPQLIQAGSGNGRLRRSLVVGKQPSHFPLTRRPPGTTSRRRHRSANDHRVCPRSSSARRRSSWGGRVAPTRGKERRDWNVVDASWIQWNPSAGAGAACEPLSGQEPATARGPRARRATSGFGQVARRARPHPLPAGVPPACRFCLLGHRSRRPGRDRHRHRRRRVDVDPHRPRRRHRRRLRPGRPPAAPERVARRAHDVRPARLTADLRRRRRG